MTAPAAGTAGSVHWIRHTPDVTGRVAITINAPFGVFRLWSTEVQDAIGALTAATAPPGYAHCNLCALDGRDASHRQGECPDTPVGRIFGAMAPAKGERVTRGWRVRAIDVDVRQYAVVAPTASGGWDPIKLGDPPSPMSREAAVALIRKARGWAKEHGFHWWAFRLVRVVAPAGKVRP